MAEVKNELDKAKEELVKAGVKAKNVLKFLTWLTGVIVSLMIGFAMTQKYIIVPHIDTRIVMVAGWAVIIVTILNVILAIFKK